MEFLKNPLVMAGVGSVVRALIVALASFLGLEANDGEIDKVVGFTTAGVLAAGSLAWSWWANKKKINAVPPGTESLFQQTTSSTRIGPNDTTLGMLLLCLMTFGGVVVQGGCAGQQARERVAVPALVSTVEAIIDEAYAGVESWPESERDTARIDVEAFQTSIASGDLVTIQTDAYARWPLVKTLAMAGIDAKLEQNLIGAAGATARRNRLMAYQDALDSLVFGPLSGK